MPPDPFIDTLAGNYRLVSRLGTGGMGDVYKGVHETIGSKVAIKILHATSAPDAEKRFMREAQVVNRIEHDGVVKVIDAGRLATGRPFLVMELLDGESLADRYKRGPIPIDEACKIVADVLDAVAAAHAAEVVHRDLKPQNIYLTRSGRVVVLDFGIAKLVDNKSLTLTAQGTAIGTPHYMAPEQIRGSKVGPAADIYAAGVVLFELLCRRLPFEGNEADVMQSHVDKRPPPPRALVPEISIPIADAVLAALAKDPAKRFADAAAMRDALRAGIAGKPVKLPNAGAAGPTTPAKPAKRLSEQITIQRPPADKKPPVSPNRVKLDLPRAQQPKQPQVQALKTDPDGPPAAALAHARRRQLIAIAAVVGVIGLLAVMWIVTRAPRGDATPTRPIDDKKAKDLEAILDKVKAMTPDAGVARAPVDARAVIDPWNSVDAAVAKPPADLGMIIIDSTPPGAEVYLDGKHVGRTPYVGSRTVGTASVRLDLRRYKAYATKVYVGTNGKARVRATLTLDNLDEPINPFE